MKKWTLVSGFLCVLCVFAVISPLLYADNWSQITFTNGSFTNTITTTGAADVTLLSGGQIDKGNGADGIANIDGNFDININTVGNGGRTAPDGVIWQITNNIASGQATVSSGVARTAGFNIGDEIIIINLKGTAGDSANVGLYEFKRITALPTGSSITVDSNLTNGYNGTTQKIVVQRVPNYTNVTINNTPMANVLGIVSYGGRMMRNGADNDVYVLPGNGSTGFYKYSIAGNSWTALTPQPLGSASGGFMIRNGADDAIYLLRGGNTNNFYRYSIAGNSWTALTVAPGTIYTGSSMLRNGADNDIYVLRGNSTSFYKYSIAGNSWTTLTVVPGFVGNGGFMIRNGADNDIYVLAANNTTSFYKYSIAGNSWTTLTVVPGAVGGGGFMLRNGADNDIYVLRGNGQTSLYKYSIAGNSWTTLTAVPGAVSGGGFMLRNGAANDIYVLPGNGSTGFYKYSIAGNSWTTLTTAPGAVNYGGFMLRNGADNDIYLLQGNAATGFYRYSISSNLWYSSGNMLVASAWNGTTGGVIVFRATGTVTVNGAIKATGYAKGNGVDGGSNAGGGETYNGVGGNGGNNAATAGTSGQGGGGGGGNNDNWSVANGAAGNSGGGGAGGGGSYSDTTGGSAAGGGGGGYATVGGGGQGGNNGISGAGVNGGAGGNGQAGTANAGGGGGGGTYGVADLSRLYFGSGGGGGGGIGFFNGGDGGSDAGANGGSGGGIIFVAANSIIINASGNISASGNNGNNSYDGGDFDGFGGGGGGGAGGSIKLCADNMSLGNNLVLATGGTGGNCNYDGGAGGNGRIRLEGTSITATTTPVASTVLSGGYAVTGTFISQAIIPGSVEYWSLLTYTVTSPTNTILTVDVLSSSNDSLLVANVPSGTDLKGAYPTTFAGISGIKLRGNFSTSDTTKTPTLSAWGVDYYSSIPVSTSNWAMLINSSTPVRMGQSIAFVKFNATTISGTAKWRRFRIDKGVTGVATPVPDNKIEIQVWCENNGNGFWDIGDTLISKGSFTNGTCYLNMKSWQVTTTTKTYYIVYKLSGDIGGGQRAGVKIADSSYLEFDNATCIGVP
ncbi:MAG: hypothetical protein HY811_11540 [Planctomycetes bacterium]|nr:hypothetical protein [Planctomycetota bacterium]